MLKTKNIYDHVAPFLKRANRSVSNCSLREGFIDLIKSSLNFSFSSCVQEPWSVLSN